MMHLIGVCEARSQSKPSWPHARAGRERTVTLGSKSLPRLV